MDLLLFLIARHLGLDRASLTSELAREAVRKRMELATPAIAGRLKEVGFSLPHLMPQPVIRDGQDDEVVAQVLPNVTATTSLMEVVTMTMAAALRAAF